MTPPPAKRGILTLAVVAVGLATAAGPLSARVPDSFDLVAESAYLRLYVDTATANFALEDKESGAVWHSNPQDASRYDRIAAGKERNRLRALLGMSYVRGNGARVAYDSYTDSVMHRQHEIRRIDGGFRVEFRLGRKWLESGLMPKVVEGERFASTVLAAATEAERETLLTYYVPAALVPVEDEPFPIEISVPGPLGEVFTERIETLLAGHTLVIRDDPYLAGLDQLADLRRKAESASGDAQQELRGQLLKMQGSLVKRKTDYAKALIDMIVADREEYVDIRSLTPAVMEPFLGRTFYLKFRHPRFRTEALLAALAGNGYTPEDIVADHGTFGMTAPEENYERFVIPLEIVLDGRGFIARVRGREIEYGVDVPYRAGPTFTTVSYPVLSLELLPFFFAARREEPGYLFVPSGSGALIDLTERKAGARSLTVPVYGGDFSLDPKPGAGDHGYLPVFGAVREDTGFLAIIESGASIASVSVLKAGVYNSYHTVFADFTITEGRTEARETGDALFGAYAIYAPESYAGDVVARYRLLPAGSADYSSMARIYREHLLERGLPRQASVAGQPLFLDVTASVPTTATVAGIPYRSTAVATGYGDARRILSDLDNPDGLVVRYAGWLAGGTAHRFPGRVSLNGKLGSRRELLRLLDFCRQHGIDFFPAVDFLAVNERGLFDGFGPSRAAARGLDRAPVRLLDRNPALTEDVPTGAYLISPAALPGLAAAFAGRYGRMDHPYLGLDRFGLLSFSDYRRGADPERIFNPEETLHVLGQTASQLAAGGFRLLIAGANAHLIPHAAAVMHVPYREADYDIVTRTIPFMQMVLHGSVPYSSEPINYRADPRTALLRAIESGSSLAFAVIHDAPELPEPLHDIDLHASLYASWKDTMVEMHGTLNRALSGLAGVPIRAHATLADGVRLTRYENGVDVVVNYRDEPYTHAGVTVGPRDYLRVPERVAWQALPW